MRIHRYIVITALLALVMFCPQSIYAGSNAKAITQDSARNHLPYDTTVSICNTAFSSGMQAISMDVGLQYVSLSKQGRIAIVDTGTNPIVIQNVFSNDSDQTWILLNNWTFPYTIQPGDTLWLPFTFNPHPYAGGSRRYQVRYTIVNSTGDTAYATASGTGVMVDMYTHIDTTYVCYLDSAVTVSLMVDSIIDPIGNDDVHGFLMEMTYYHHSAVYVDTMFNLGVDLRGKNAPGQQGTMSQGATVVENVAEDLDFTSGSRGYYELIAESSTDPVQTTGTLMNFRFRGIAMDSSWLVYNIKGIFDDQGNPISYVQIYDNPGLIKVIAPPRFGFSVYPNPFDQSAAIHFMINNATHAKLTVYNSLGQSVGTIVDQYLSPGDFTANFTGAGLPNGMYFYTLATTSSGTYHGQMELLR